MMNKHFEKTILVEVESISNIGLWELDLITNSFYWSDGMYKIYGYAPQEFKITFDKSLEFIHLDDRQMAIDKMEETIKTGKEYAIRKRIITKTKELKYILSKGKIIKDKKGIALKAMGVFQDITEIVILEKKVSELKDRNQFIETIIENLPMGIAVNKIDDGSATIINKSFISTYGLKDEDLGNVSAFFEKVYPDETLRNKIITRMKTDVESGDPKRMNWDHTVATSAGEKRIINTRQIPLFEQNLIISTVVDVTEKIKKNSELENANNILKNAQRLTKMGNWEYNLNTDELFWSDEVYHIFEKEKDPSKKLSFKDFSKYVPQKDLSVLIAAKLKIVEDGTPLNVIHRITTKNKNKKIVKELAERVYNEETKSYWLIGTIRDNTEAILGQQQIEKSEKNYKNLFENNPAPMFIFDFKSLQIIDCNQELLITYGYTKEEFLKLSIKDLGLKEDIKQIDLATVSEAAYGKIYKGGWRHKKKNGEIMFVEVTGHIIDYKGNRCSLVQIIDVTEKKKAELELKNSEEKYKLLFQNSPLPNWIYDIETYQILDVNETAIKHYGYHRNEFLRLSNLGIKPKYSLAEEKRIHQRFNSKDAIINLGISEHIKKDKTIIKVEISGHSIRFQDKDCVLVSCNDITEKELVIEKIKNSEEQRKLIMNGALDGIICIDKIGNVTFWNPQAKNIFGWEEFEVIGKNLSNVIVPLLDRNKHKEVILNFQNIKSSSILNKLSELSAIKKDGIEFPIELTAIPIKQGIEEFFCLFIRDITERKKAESLIKKGIERYNYVTKATDDAIWDWDLITDSIYWGDGFHTLFGYDIETLASDSSSWTKNIHPNDYDRVIKGIQEVINSPDSESNWADEYRYLKYDGIYAFVHDKGTIIRDENQIAIRIVGAMHDVTSKKEEELRLKLLESVIVNTNDAVLITEAEPYNELGPKIIYVNEAFTKMTGYTTEEVIGKTPKILQGPKTNKSDLKKLSKAIKDWNSCEITTINYKKNGEAFYVNFSVTPVANEKNKYTHWVAIERDVTAKIIAEQELKNAFDEKNTILESIADAFFTVDTHFKVTYWNKIAEKISGKKRVDILGKNFWDTFPDLIDSVFFKNYYKALLENISQHFEAYYEAFNSWFEVSVYPSKSGISVYFKDASERKNAEIALKTAYSEKNIILESIGDGFFTVDINWIVNYWNHQAEKLLMVSKETMLNKCLWDVFTNSNDTPSYIKYHEAMETREIINFEDYYNTLERWYEISAYPSEIGLSVYFKDITQRKQIQQQFEAVINNIPGITYRCKMDENWTMLFMSDGVLDITGYPADDFIHSKHRTFASIIHDEDLMSTYNLNESLKNHEIFEIEYRIICTDGSIKWVQDKGRGVYNADNSILYIDGVIMDVTDRKNSLKELEKAYQEKNDVLESIDDGFFAIDKNALITYWNKKAEVLLGAKKEQVLGKNIRKIFAHANSMVFNNHYQLAIKENRTIHFEEFSTRSQKWFEVSAFPSELGLSVYFKDVTDKKNVEERIESERNLLRTLIDNLPDTIYVKDQLARTIISNKKDYELLGAKVEEEVIGKTVLEILPPHLATATHYMDLDIIKTGKPQINTIESFVTKDHITKWFMTSKVPLRNEKKEIIGLIAIGRDITERKNNEEELELLNIELEQNIKQLQISNSELEQFAYIASHDLQEPLRMISSFLTQIDKKYGEILDEKGKQYIYFAIDGAQRMKQIILDLLEFSKVGRSTDDLEVINFQDILVDIKSLFRKQIEETNAQIEIINLPKITNYRIPIRQVLQNLVSNALKYSIKSINPVIKIKGEEKPNYWLISVEDNGIGIEKEYYKKIFIIFQRLHLKEEYSGTGMGLAICKKIIENLGGEIWVESNEGKGACFYFTIPKH